MHGKNIFYKEKIMGKKKNSYYLRDLDDFIVGTDMVKSDTYGAKSRRSSPSRAMDLNPIEPNPSKPPVKPKKPVYADANPIEPNPSKPPVKPRKSVYADANPIEPNPSTPPVKPKKSVYADANPIEPNPSKPPVKPRKPVDADADPIEPNPSKPPVKPRKPVYADLNLVEPNPGNSTNDGLKPDSGTLGSGVNTEGDTLQKNAVKTNQQQTEDVAVSQKIKSRDLLLSKRGHTDNAALAEFSRTSRKDILELRRNKPASIIVDYDTQGREVTLDDFNVDGMDISIKREHDGYGNKFDSVRTIETVKLANGQVVKCNIQDMVGANAESKAFADEHKGMTLPDGKYHFTAKKLTKQSDGTYNSDCFQNTLRLQTKDSNIPKNIRDDINSKYYLFHATEYKKGFIPEDGGNRIWINPWSAGCISSITGGQSTHDDFMNMLTGITPENINVTITSKRHVDI